MTGHAAARPRLPLAPVVVTTNARPPAGVPKAAPAIGSPADALAEIATWPGYHPTPVLALPGLAAAVGVEAVWVKHEAPRFGQGSFKPLGAGLAVARVVSRHVAQATGRPGVRSVDLLTGGFRDVAANVVVACATDGNHGRAVAWAARLFGARAVVFLASHVSPDREAAIEALGAEVRRSTGNHDEAVREAARWAARKGWTMISETGSAGDDAIPRDMLSGYAAIAEELAGQWDGDAGPSHLLVPVGVGGLAAGLVAWFAGRDGSQTPRMIAVEALEADCLRRSLLVGHRVAVTGSLTTVMGGLAAGEVSAAAWPWLQHGVDAAIGLGDEAVVPALRLLADGAFGDPPLEAGESGGAALAALLAVAENEEDRTRLGLDAGARVLVIVTEGVTDPVVWERLTGRPPAGDRVLS